MGEIPTPSLRIPLFPWGLVRRNWHIYLAFLMRHTGANCIWAIYSLFIASIGGDKFWISVIFTVNTISQFAIMNFIDRFDAEKLVSAGMVLSATTFLSFSFAQHYLELVPLQVLLATSWSCLFVGSLLYLMKHNVERATSAGILSSVISLGSVSGALLSGIISQFFGFRATMYTAAVFTLIGFLFFQAGLRR